ncbi:MAG: hypothetical protein R2752_23175 [Vicinamibacterales bacterium]
MSRTSRVAVRGTLMAALAALPLLAAPAPAHAQDGPVEYRVLATTRTSTMQREINAAAAQGFRFDAVMGGETAIGGNETVVIVSRRPGDASKFEYRLLATNRTSTMEQEMQAASDAGFHYRGQTVFSTSFGGKEVIVILERDIDHPEPGGWDYRLLATSRTSTMEKEVQQAANQGFTVVGLTVADTAIRGKELVTIMRRKRP